MTVRACPSNTDPEGGSEYMRKTQKRFTRTLAALMAFVLTLTLAPAAMAQTLQCPRCTQITLQSEILHEANCHETGIIEYKCTNRLCDYEKLEKVPVNPSNHDVIYKDNGDGTHSGECRYHTSYTVKSAAHKFVNGACELCSALNYGAVDMVGLAEQKNVSVPLNDSTAKLSAAGITLVLGSADITGDYTLQYHWYDYNQNGREVGSGAEYQLPASVYGKEGTYYYSLVVMATPKSSIARQPLSKTCSFVVTVEDLLSASAVVTTQDSELYFGLDDGWSSGTISSQIYDAVQTVCPGTPDPTV